jgi:hypothetical protein
VLCSWICYVYEWRSTVCETLIVFCVIIIMKYFVYVPYVLTYFTPYSFWQTFDSGYVCMKKCWTLFQAIMGNVHNKPDRKDAPLLLSCISSPMSG